MIGGLPALELARVRVLGADQKKSGLLGRIGEDKATTQSI